jgi:O-antigen/teichoic acid export membrane protein
VVSFANILTRMRAELHVGSRLRAHAASILALGVRGTSVLAGLAVTYVIARRMGAAATAEYALVTQTALLLSTIGLIGMEQAAVRHFSGAVASKLPLSGAMMSRVTGLLAALFLALSALLLLGSDLLSSALSTEIPLGIMVILCVLLVARGLTKFFGAVLRSQRAFTSGQALDTLLVPAGVALLLLAGALNNVTSALQATAALSVAGALIGGAAVACYARFGLNNFAVSFRTLSRSSLALWGSSVAAIGIEWYSLAAAAALLGPEEAGMYRVCVQAAAALQLSTAALYGVYGPRISASFHSANPAWTGRLTRSATRVTVIVSVPVAMLLLVFAEPLLSLIGPEFVTAAPVLRILVVGQVVFALTGPSGLTLAMSGNERANLMISLVSAALLLAVVPLAAQTAGLVGVALAVAMMLSARNVAAFVLVRRLTGINVVTGSVRSNLEIPC